MTLEYRYNESIYNLSEDESDEESTLRNTDDIDFISNINLQALLSNPHFHRNLTNEELSVKYNERYFFQAVRACHNPHLQNHWFEIQRALVVIHRIRRFLFRQRDVVDSIISHYANFIRVSKLEPLQAVVPGSTSDNQRPGSVIRPVLPEVQPDDISGKVPGDEGHE